MTDTNTVPGIDLTEFTGTRVYISVSIPTIWPFIRVPHHGRAPGLLSPATPFTLLSSSSIESDLVAITQLPSRSGQTTDSRLVPDEQGPEARQIRRAALHRLRRAHFPLEARGRRIATALAALRAPNPFAGVDRATLKWAAEEADLEDI